MRKKFCVIGLLVNIFLSAQEFETFKNGLIYSENTMTKLSKIVDSLNLKYKSCDLNKVFYSKYQQKGYLINLHSGNVTQAKKDIINNISIEDFLVKYPGAQVKKNVLIIRSKAKDYDNKDIIRYDEITVNNEDETNIQQNFKKSVYERSAKNTWAYEYASKSSYSTESIRAFYFPEDFKSIPLQPQYANQIIYSDCLIDTSVSKFKKDANDKKFSEFIGLPENWKSMSVEDKNSLLDKMRSHVAVGTCSHDQSPRIQGVNMALLSAETANWKIFLKSHLDIMNDRFERISDGSYAWKSRETYIKELEELNINVYDLIFGTIFRIENPETNHYYGNIGRLGRAVSESKERDHFFTQMISMIEDEKLDDYNRIIAYYFFVNCNYYTSSPTEKKLNNTKLIKSIKKLPTYLANQIVIESL